MNKLLTYAALLITMTIAFAVPAQANDNPQTVGKTDRENAQLRLDRKGDRIDARLDEKAYLISQRYARRAARAEKAGKFEQAHRLQVKGEQLRQHFDRKGDRINARLDQRAERIGRHNEQQCCNDNSGQHPGDRHDRRLAWQDDRPRWRTDWHRHNAYRH